MVCIYIYMGGENVVEIFTNNPNKQGKINQGKPFLARKNQVFTKEKLSKEKPHLKKQARKGRTGSRTVNLFTNSMLHSFWMTLLAVCD